MALGMVLAMGCAGAVFYRLGEGKLDYAFAIAAFSAGAWAANNWLVIPLRGWLGTAGVPLTLHTALTMDRWVLMAIVVVAVVLWVIRGKRRAYAGGWDWTRHRHPHRPDRRGRLGHLGARRPPIGAGHRGGQR